MAVKDLTSYAALESALFLKWEIPDLAATLISDYNTPITIDSDVYTNVGTLLSITGSKSELKLSPSQLSITLSGVPSGEIAKVLDNEIKGSSITITRAFFNPTTHNVISGLDPMKVFTGIVTNYGISDDVDPVAMIASTTISLTCNSIVDVLAKKVNGRRTNPVDFPNEDSMNRVQTLVSSNFQFGAPK